MKLQDLLMVSTVEFPRPITLEEADKLLDSLSRNLPATIHSQTEYFERRYAFNEEPFFQKSRGTFQITGSISSTKNPMAFDSFRTIPYQSGDLETPKISAIQFQTIPGYSLEEHRLEVQQLWQEVRNLVNEYFLLEEK